MRASSISLDYDTQIIRCVQMSFFFFLVCDKSSLRQGLFSSCGRQGILSSCSAQASHCSGFSCCGERAFNHIGFSSCGSRPLDHELITCGERA